MGHSRVTGCNDIQRLVAGHFLCYDGQWSKDPQKLSMIAEKLRTRVSKNVEPVFFYPGEPSSGADDELALE